MTQEQITLSAREIAELLKIKERWTRRRAQRESWAYIEKSGNGGKIKRYLLHALPAEIQAAYRTHICNNNETDNFRTALQDSSQDSHKDLLDRPARPNHRAGSFLVSTELSAWQNRIAGARYDLCVIYARDLEAVKRDKKKGKAFPTIAREAEDFVEAYNTGIPYPAIYKILGKVANKTLRKWSWALKKSNYDMRVLAPRFGQHRKGRRMVTDDELQGMLKWALHPNRLRISQIIRWTKRELKKDGASSPSSEATLRRAILDWKAEHYDIWVFAREGEKALSDKVLPYIERDASRLGVGDIFVADGHVLNFTIINPFTGRPGRAMLLMFYDWASAYPAGWNIMFTENIQNIHAALRRAILNLGKIPKFVCLDNGKAFKAKVFCDTDINLEQAGIQGLYARLGIETYFARKYNARAKVIERFFETFNEVERLIPSYTGASIKDKPAYLMRNERIHKKLHNPWVPTIAEAGEIIKAWAWDEYAKRPHSGLGGAHPAQLWEAGKGLGIDEEPLRFLMMSQEVKGIGRNGITLMGVHYWDEALYGYRKKVLVRYDIEDLEKIHVYTQDGATFLCEARPVSAVHPLARMTGNPLDMEALKKALTNQSSLKKETIKGTRARIATTPMPLGIADISRIPPAIEEHPASAEPKFTPEERKEIQREAAEVIALPETKPRPQRPTYWIRKDEEYEWLLRKRLKGESLNEDEILTIEKYETTKEYQILKPYWKRFKENVSKEYAEGRDSAAYS